MRQHPSILKRASLSGAVLALALVAVGSARADAKVYERTLRSTAWVVSHMPNDKDSFGTGFVIDAKRKWVVTNYHVVEDRKHVVVFFPEYKGDQVIAELKHYVGKAEKLAVPGEVIVRDKKRDLVLIQLKSLPSGVAELPLAAKSAKPGETIHAIGNSGVNDSVLWRYSKGEVRQVYDAKFKSKASGGGTVELEARVVESQVPVNPGDSGGPMVNDRGELVGVTQSSDLRQRLVSCSVDVTEVRSFLRSAIETHGKKK